MGIVRAYHADDESQVKALYEKTWTSTDSISPWYKPEEDCPSHLAPITYVYEEQERIVGFSSLLPTEAYIRGEEEHIGVLTDVFVDQEADPTNVSQELNNKLIEIAEEMDLRTLVSLSADKENSMFCQDKRCIGGIQRFTKRNVTGILNGNFILKNIWKKAQKPVSEIAYELWKIEELHKPDEKLNQFLDKKRRWKTVQIRKDNSYYQWRYNKEHYQYLQLMYDDEVAGYAIIHTKKKGKLKEAFIYDILAIDHPTAWDLLIQALRNKLQSFDIIHLCVCPDQLVFEQLKKNGFKMSDQPFHVNVIDFDDTLQDITVDEWWLQLGDTREAYYL